MIRGGEVMDASPALVRAVQIADEKGMLLHELISRLRRIREEFGERAAETELALQAALHDEKAQLQAEQLEKMKR